MRTYIKDLNKEIDKEVLVEAWVKVRRDQGKMIFLDLRDVSGVVQAVILPFHKEALEVSNALRTEWCVSINAKVNKRPEKNIKTDVQNGDIELEVLNINVLNESNTPPFDLTTDGLEVNEEVRLKYRYLDLRRERLSKTLKNRSKVQQFIRNYLIDNNNFTEVETPLLSAPTPEGSRSYVVPSRLWKDNFYSLPQSPQQYKQLLMVGGIERYFQFARCMRDEDTRGDRQPEFTQLDMELSFVSEEDIINLNEDLIIKTVEKFYPEKKIQQIPFPRMSYKEAMEKYGNDRPDIREDKNDSDLLAFLWVVDFPMFEKTSEDNLDGTGEWTFTHNPFSRPRDEYMNDFVEKKNIGNILTTQYDITLNGFEIGGGSLRNHKGDILRKTFEIMGYDKEKIDRMFGHMIEALDFGAPPHGGIAWGFDRFIMLMENEPNIREVIPFAKTGEGKDLMMNAPSGISDKQKKELGLKFEVKG
ncbi:MAG: aspartyl-tRNA synthetase [Patescibacteria group bacterium]|nr:aspartyl-tRNA synthetase [Patescibacteria group bacterium]